MAVSDLPRSCRTAPPLPLPGCSEQQGIQEVTMTRTFGAAIGALIFVFFMSYMAERLTTVQASSPRPAASQR
jgi:hypothetical protein